MASKADAASFIEMLETAATELGDAGAIPGTDISDAELRQRFVALETHSADHCELIVCLARRGGFQSDRIKALENSVGALGLLLCLICVYLAILRLTQYV